MRRRQSARPQWRQPAVVGPSAGGGRLLAAFLTTFNPPEAKVLVEELLPDWLGLSNFPVDEGLDRLRFFAELEEELKRLKGRFTIVSTMGASVPTGNGWIWNYIHRLQVGFRRAATQHAKLWLFHRAGVGGSSETLEVVVSSQNLTGEGVRGQIQAGWRCTVPLAADRSPRRRLSWGALSPFLDQLADACGPSGRRAVPYWQGVLERAACPREATFIGSVPGVHPADPPKSEVAWGAAALRRLGGAQSRSLAAMVPTVGNWDARSLESWMKVARVEPPAFNLAWVEPVHPWAPRWQLNAATEKALSACKVNWLHLPSPHDGGEWRSPLCEEHKPADTRWSHCKVYELGSNGERRLLVTSANFSRAAWGDVMRDGRTLQIDNFELGVAIPGDAGLAHRSRKRAFIRATGATSFEKNVDDPIAWMDVRWDGNSLAIEVRLAGDTRLDGSVGIEIARGPRTEVVHVGHMRPPSIRVPWPVARGVPLRTRLTTKDGWSCEVAVQDVRKADADEWLCDAASETEMQDLADRLLEERYHFFDEDEPAPARKAKKKTPGSQGATYAVAAYEDSRRRFAAIDHWAGTLEEADGQVRAGLLRDGERIAKRWLKIAGDSSRPDIAVSASLAAEELLARVRRERGRK